MEDINISENIIKDFKELCKKYDENLSQKHQELLTSLTQAQERNENLFNNIQQMANESIIPVAATSVDILPNKLQNMLETCGTNLNNTTEQLKNINLTSATNIDQETKRLQETFYQMITQDEVALKPYDDVEKATIDLKQKTASIVKKHDDEKQKCLDILKDREQFFIQLKEDMAVLEPIEKELRLDIQNAKTKHAENMKYLNLKSIDDATINSTEAKELLEEIADLKSKLNI